jgi:NADPH:quinone reductase-like Zn-dependent oxidoreductase
LGDAGLNGGYAELVSIGEENVAAVPDEVALDEAAIVACAIGTELNAIRDVAEVRLGERVLVTGAGGGLGIHGIQLARLAGAHTIAVTTSAAKVVDIRAAGADEVLVVAPGEDFSARIKALTGGAADVAIDNVGSAVFQATRRSLADGGRYVLVGQLTGDLIDINPAQLFLRDISLLSAKGVSRAQLEECLRLVARRRVRPVIGGEFPLDEAGAAHRMVEQGRSMGRLLLKPG